MAGEEHGHALCGLVAQDLAHGVHGNRVETGEGLVQDEDFGVVDQGGGQLDALLDSAAFIDPLFSSGVWLGTSAAWLAARAIGAALEDAEQEQLALERFDALYRQMFKDILAYVRFFMDPTRLREEYEERALQIQNMVTQNSRVGFISMISGVSAIADVVDFDPMNVEDVEDVMQDWDEQTAAASSPTGA
ncbi:hypothetical protein ACIQCF_12530 [Streptomyces sp. NPDC088353]|uniref:hypothetical protein n=1 Tax=unclassified Streptomyces TaxID=2593676 RepID=UPI0036C4D41D